MMYDAYMSWHSPAAVHFVLWGRKLSLEHCTLSHLVDSEASWSSYLHPLLSPKLVLELRKTNTCIDEHRTELKLTMTNFLKEFQTLQKHFNPI